MLQIVNPGKELRTALIWEVDDQNGQLQNSDITEHAVCAASLEASDEAMFARAGH